MLGRRTNNRRNRHMRDRAESIHSHNSSHAGHRHHHLIHSHYISSSSATTSASTAASTTVTSGNPINTTTTTPHSHSHHTAVPAYQQQQQQPSYHHHHHGHQHHPRTNSTISHTSCPPLSPTNNNNTHPIMALPSQQQQQQPGAGLSTIGHDALVGQDNTNDNGNGPVPVLFSWPDPDNEQPHTVLVASFDNFLHHAMTPRPRARDIAVTLPVLPGRHTYKFLVNGIWKTHRFLHDTHPIEQSPDGVRYHVLHVDPAAGCTTSCHAAMADSTAANSDNNKSSDVMADIITPEVHKEEEKKFDPSLTAHHHLQTQTVFRSASSSADGPPLHAGSGTGSCTTSTVADSVSIPSPGATGAAAMADSGKMHAHAQHSHHQHFPSYSLLTPHPEVGLAPRGTSFNTAPVMHCSLSPAGDNGSNGGVLTGSTTGRRLTDADMDGAASSDTKGDAKKARTVMKSGSGHRRDADVRLAAMSSAHDASTAGQQQQRQRLPNNIGSTTHGFLHLHHHHQSGASIAGNHNTLGSLHGLVSSTSASAAVAPSMSMAGDQRKSLLHRVGGWRRRFSHRGGDGAVSELGGFSSSLSCSSSAAFANAQMAHASTVAGGGGGGGIGNMHHSLSRVNLQLQQQQQQAGVGNGLAGVHDGSLMNGSSGNDRKDRSASALFRNTERERGGGREQTGNIHHHQQHQYRSHHNVSQFSFNGHALFPSSSEPVVCRASVSGVLQLDDKENMGGQQQQQHHDSMSNHNMNHAWHSQSHHHPSNSGKHHKHHGPMMTMTPDRRKFRGSSNRSQGLAKVSVSMPMAVDQPRNEAEVHKQADNWRQMAKHLTDSLHDPSAARELLIKAISHREKHGLRLCASNAQVHTDLARNLSKADDMNEAEKHLRIALDIFATLRVNPDTQADLKLYIGVMVDRQKKRKEAELLYRQALDMYKSNGLDKTNNMNIAIKNLVLNLKKQDRVDEAGSVYEQYGRNDD